MNQTAEWTGKRIFECVQNVLASELGIIRQDITPENSLINDLGAEIFVTRDLFHNYRDFDCIAQRFEALFHIKIRTKTHGFSIDPDLLLHQKEFSTSQLTHEGVQRIKTADHLSWVDRSHTCEGASMGDVLTVRGLCIYIEEKLQEQERVPEGATKDSCFVGV